ncbi:MFS transporter [Pseudonocardia humida]|uniref:MFS transporter n=1 Tax=Pseudonocardia humida TaxID=2800819 RepID=A0ABT1A1I2_9PSEU|nr:MFS transporter [Pseudonocardia humida]MCO1656866.1 MFS transporter [Pseudonocardia humida]
MALGPARSVITLLALSLSTFVFVTTETLPIGLLPLIADDLGVTQAAVGLLVTGYGMVVVLATIPLTRFTRRVRRRPLLAALLGVSVVGTSVSALADDYPVLLASRLGVALSQALFWSVVTPAAAALFPAATRGRALSILYAGSSLAAVAGVPVGTWLGQLAGWRSAFLAVAALGLIPLLVVAVLLPEAPAGGHESDRGSAPDRGRYLALLAATALAVSGAFSAFTYVSPFLVEVAGFPLAATGPLLLARGIAGVLGVLAVGLLVDRNPWLTMTAVVGLQAVALGAQYALGAVPVVAVVAVAAAGLALSALAAVLGARALVVAPGSTAMASAGASTAFNVGITGGALLGGLLLPAGVGTTALAGALLSLAALVVLLAEPALSSTGRRKAVGEPVRIHHAVG